MADEPNRPQSAEDVAARRLVKETGITEGQARELIVLLGLNWSSLLLEARIHAGRP